MHVKPRGQANDPHHSTDKRGYSVYVALLQVKVSGELSCESQDNRSGVWRLAAGGRQEVEDGKVNSGANPAGGSQVCPGDGEADTTHVQCPWTIVFGGYYFDECRDSVCRELFCHHALLYGQVCIMGLGCVGCH